MRAIEFKRMKRTITINHRIKVRKKMMMKKKITPKIENLILCYYILIILPTYANIINRLAIIVEHLHWISFSLTIIPFSSCSSSPSPSSYFFYSHLLSREKKTQFHIFQTKKLTTKWVELKLKFYKVKAEKKLQKIIFTYFVNILFFRLLVFRLLQCCVAKLIFIDSIVELLPQYNIIVADFLFLA